METTYYDYGMEYGQVYEPQTDILGAIAAITGFITIISIICSILVIVCNWIIFKKAGKKGWEAIVPVYNLIVMLEIANLPMWYLALFFIPGANIYAMFKIYIEIAHKFGKSTGFGVGLALLGVIFLPILAFGKSTYENSNYSDYNQMNYGFNQNYNQMPNQNMNPNPNPMNNQYNQNNINEYPNMGQNINQMPNQYMNQNPNQNMNQSSMNNQNINPNPNPINAEMPNQNGTEQQTKICPMCGNPVNINSNFCTKCGYNYNN